MGGNTTYDSESAPVVPEDARCVLLLSSVGAGTEAICGELLDVGDPTRTNYLAVTFDGSPDQRLDHWRRHVSPERPAKVGIVVSGGVARSTTATGGDAADGGRSDVRVATVPSPGDLTGVGVRISECLSAWAGDGNRLVICIDSLTTMLQYVETETAFRFLHTLLARCSTADATVHAHITPEAHDERTVRTIESLFDAVVERDVGGDWHVR